LVELVGYLGQQDREPDALDVLLARGRLVSRVGGGRVAS
jgi:xanthine/CO dehydrogenase XdhC/CoxF family maturation factor